MNKSLYCAGGTRAAVYAAGFLAEKGLILRPEAEADYILLDVPSLNAQGRLRSGQAPEELLGRCSANATVIGGSLQHPAFAGHRTVDLLTDEGYLAQNAWITAEAALDVALPCLEITLRDCPALVIGWGRIGKCLARLLRAMGGEVTVAARKPADRAMLHALGYKATDTRDPAGLSRYRLILNTVPEPVLTRQQLALCCPECVKIELASRPGMEDPDVIQARGLPGLHFPESSGRLIAETIIRKEKLL